MRRCGATALLDTAATSVRLFAPMLARVRRLLDAFDIRLLSELELHILADAHEGRLSSWNYLEFYPSSAFQHLLARGLIVFDPIRDERGNPIMVYEWMVPGGVPLKAAIRLCCNPATVRRVEEFAHTRGQRRAPWCLVDRIMHDVKTARQRRLNIPFPTDGLHRLNWSEARTRLDQVRTLLGRVPSL